MSASSAPHQGAAPAISAVRLVLFDLDGTLADTAPDLVAAINGCLQSRGLPPRPFAELRGWASHGARGLIGEAFGLAPGEPGFDDIRREFLERYQRDLCVQTRLFDGVAQLLERLEAAGLRWGIVTNKVTHLTTPLVQALGLNQRAACVVSGDTAARAKPHPDPIEHALQACGQPARASVYVGDDLRDIQAGRAAGVRTFAAAYGYSAEREDVLGWEADHVLQAPQDLLAYVLP